MSVSCTYRGLLGLKARLQLQAELHGKDLVEALALVQGWKIPAVTVDAPPIIVAGYDEEYKTLFVELVGKASYAYEHKPLEDGSEVWEEVIISFLKELPYGYGALTKFKEATTSSICSSRVRGQIREYWLVRQYELVNIPLRRRPVLMEKQGQQRKGRKKKSKKLETPPLSSQALDHQLHLF